MDFNAYRPHVLSQGCPDCKGRSSGDLCGLHRNAHRRIEQIKLGIQALARKAVDMGFLNCGVECNRCRVSGMKLVAHHNDYNLPFAIEWLCHACHSAHHAPERNEMYQVVKRDRAERAAQKAA